MSASAAAVDVARSIASYLHPTVAIITGASSGMGKEFARQIDRLHTVDEIWLIARNQQALEDTAAPLSTRTVCIPLDLTDPSAIDTMQHKLIDMHPEVLYLINAAGFGKFGDWRHISNNDTTNMIELNCRALVSLTRAVLPYMHRGARLLQLASCAAFTPLPHMNIYAATKAFVLSYTRALRWELHGSGITVTAICPAWVKTGFEKVGARFRRLARCGSFTLPAKSVHCCLTRASCQPSSFCGSVLRIQGVWLAHRGKVFASLHHHGKLGSLASSLVLSLSQASHEKTTFPALLIHFSYTLRFRLITHELSCCMLRYSKSL